MPSKSPRSNARNASNLPASPTAPQQHPGVTMITPATALAAAQMSSDGESVCREVIEGVVRDACVVAINRVLDNLARPYAVQSLCNELLDCITATFVARDSGAIRPSGWAHVEDRDAPRRIAIDPDARSTMETVYRAQTPSVTPTGPSPSGNTTRTRSRSFSASKPPVVGSAGVRSSKGGDESESTSPRSIPTSSISRVFPRSDKPAVTATISSTTTTSKAGSSSTVARKKLGKKGDEDAEVAIGGDVPPPYAKYLPSPDTVDQEEIDFAVARYAEDRRKDSITDKHTHLSKQLQTLPKDLWGTSAGTTSQQPQPNQMQQPSSPSIRGGDISKATDSSSFISHPGSPSPVSQPARTPNSPIKGGGWSAANAYKSSVADVIIDGTAGRVIKVTKIGSLREGGGGGGRSPDGEGKNGRGGTSGVGYVVADKPKKKKKVLPAGTRRTSVDTDEGSAPETTASDTNKSKGRLSPLTAASARRVKSGPRHFDKGGRDQAFFVPDPQDNPNRMHVSLSAVKGVNATGEAAVSRNRGPMQQSVVVSGSATPHGGLTPRKTAPMGNSPVSLHQSTYPPGGGGNVGGSRSAPSLSHSTTMPASDPSTGLPQGWSGGTARAAVMEARRMAK